MSLEAALAEHTAALKENTAALLKVDGNQQRLIAGQEAAIAKIEGGRTTTPRTPKPAAETPAATPPAAQTPKTETPAAPPPATESAVTTVVTDDDIKKAAGAWMGGKPDDQRKAASVKLNELLAFFGVGGKLTGPESKLDDDQRKQTLFFIKRWAEGLEVNFSADYDFDGDPCQGVAGEEEADPLG